MYTCLSDKLVYILANHIREFEQNPFSSCLINTQLLYIYLYSLPLIFKRCVKIMGAGGGECGNKKTQDFTKNTYRGNRQDILVDINYRLKICNKSIWLVQFCFKQFLIRLWLAKFVVKKVLRVECNKMAAVFPCFRI